MEDNVVRLSLIGLAGVIGLGATLALGQGSGFVPLTPGPDDGGPFQNRLYGRVITTSGEEFQGFIRWDRNEGSWADLLDAYKRLPRSVTSGIRFGHIHRIEVLDDDAALLILKSGEEIELGAHSTDLGDGLRALIVEDPVKGTTRLRWRDLDIIEFMPASEAGDFEPEGRRLYGTLTTRSGDQFTGYVAWDVDEIYTTDVLDGEEDGYDYEIAFGEIATIERHSSRAARVVLDSGEELRLRDSNDVNDSNRGIAISDPELGQVSVTWDEFESIRFHEAKDHASYSEFEGGVRIYGTVATDQGDEFEGFVRWDNDEAYTWEMLDGDSRGVEYSVEFGKISRIEKTSSRGVRVELLDGRTFRLRGSNDVDEGNRGIVIETEEGEVTLLDWGSFAELRISQ